jgi:hypothetical protein
MHISAGFIAFEDGSIRHILSHPLDHKQGFVMSRRPIARSERYDVPQPFIELASRRTEFLFRHLQFGNTPLHIIISSAYLQGMSDVVDTMDAKGMFKEGNPNAPTEVESRGSRNVDGAAPGGSDLPSADPDGAAGLCYSGG